SSRSPHGSLSAPAPLIGRSGWSRASGAADSGCVSRTSRTTLSAWRVVLVGEWRQPTLCELTTQRERFGARVLLQRQVRDEHVARALRVLGPPLVGHRLARQDL